MYKFSTYKEQYKSILQLAIPVIFSQLGQIVVQLVDNIMVGQYGGTDATPLASTSFGGTFFFLIYIGLMGISLGITPLVGELFSQGHHKESTKYLTNSIILFPILAVIAMIIQFAAIPLMDYMGQPAEVIAMATPYYKTLVWSMFPLSIFFIFKQFLEGIGNTKTTMVIVLISNVINVILNYMLIYGNCGFEAMGALGAGVATMISRIAQALFIAGYFFYAKRFALYRSFIDFKEVSITTFKKLFAMGLPISAQIFMESSAFVFVSILFGAFGSEGISANQIGNVLANSSFMILIALGSAITIIISHSYGQRDVKQIKLASAAAWHLGLAWNIISAIIFISLCTVLPRMFTSNEEVISLASILLIYIAAFQLPDGIQCIGIGILRGIQDVSIIIPIAIFSYWLLNIPIAYLCAFNFDQGAESLYIGFVVGLWVASVLIFLRYRNRLRKMDAEK